eukprot:Hpha_TRINITY_DN9646_c0_g1::TRINITY_DN9646_c0_g1_i1::g.184248::m.184248
MQAPDRAGHQHLPVVVRRQHTLFSPTDLRRSHESRIHTLLLEWTAESWFAVLIPPPPNDVPLLSSPPLFPTHERKYQAPETTTRTTTTMEKYRQEILIFSPKEETFLTPPLSAPLQCRGRGDGVDTVICLVFFFHHSSGRVFRC